MSSGVMRMKLRINISPRALIKTAEIVSNSVLLTANTYLLGTNLINSFKNRKRDRILDNLQNASEIANSLAGLTKVIVETIGKHHATS